MGAFSSNHIDFTKGYPSVYAVDHSAAVSDENIVEGMGIHLNDSGQWVRGCPAGKLPFVTGQAQSPTALDVARNSNEMGGGLMGGVALSQGLGFDTTEFVGSPIGRYCSCPATGANAGKFAEAGEDEQIVCWCQTVFADAYSDSVARMVAAVMPSIGDGYSSVSSQSESSVTESSRSSRSESSESDVSTSSST